MIVEIIRKKTIDPRLIEIAEAMDKAPGNYLDLPFPNEDILKVCNLAVKSDDEQDIIPKKTYLDLSKLTAPAIRERFEYHAMNLLARDAFWFEFTQIDPKGFYQGAYNDNDTTREAHGYYVACVDVFDRIFDKEDVIDISKTGCTTQINLVGIFEKLIADQVASDYLEEKNQALKTMSLEDYMEKYERRN